MSDQVIFLSMFAITFIVTILAWVCFGLPYVRSKSVWTELAFPAVFLLYQHLAFATIAKSVVGNVAPQFGYIAAACNVLTIPLVAALCVACRNKSARAFFWAVAVTIAGIVSGLATFSALFYYNVIPELQAHWYVGTMYVPIQALCHIFIFDTLRTRSREFAARN